MWLAEAVWLGNGTCCWHLLQRVGATYGVYFCQMLQVWPGHLRTCSTRDRWGSELSGMCFLHSMVWWCLGGKPRDYSTYVLPYDTPAHAFFLRGIQQPKALASLPHTSLSACPGSPGSIVGLPVPDDRREDPYCSTWTCHTRRRGLKGWSNFHGLVVLVCQFCRMWWSKKNLLVRHVPPDVISLRKTDRCCQRRCQA